MAEILFYFSIYSEKYPGVCIPIYALVTPFNSKYRKGTYVQPVGRVKRQHLRQRRRRLPPKGMLCSAILPLIP